MKSDPRSQPHLSVTSANGVAQSFPAVFDLYKWVYCQAVKDNDYHFHIGIR